MFDEELILAERGDTLVALLEVSRDLRRHGASLSDVARSLLQRAISDCQRRIAALDLILESQKRHREAVAFTVTCKPPETDQATPVVRKFRSVRRRRRPAPKLRAAPVYVVRHIEPSGLPAPVVAIDSGENCCASHFIGSQIDRQAAAMLARAPWNKRKRRSRRYEGFGA